jgi:methionyl-tRNA synthetase
VRPQYFTTPIYYVNGKPHIGHAYSTVVTDALYRYARVRGRQARFLTGTDEHGQKVERKAKEEGLSPKAFVDRLIPDFTSAWDALNCRYDDFIRTTDARHEAFVAELWKRCVQQGDIYLGAYEGWYSTTDEAYYTEKDVENGRAKETGSVVEWVKEPTYFFRLSAYTDRLLAFYEQHPRFIVPEGRFNEVKAFVKEGLRDLSLSRNTVRWGIPVPGDPEFTIYVWFDALTNYVSALCDGAYDGALPDTDLFRTFWPSASGGGEVTHVMGKEITRFHAVYWPAFLMSAGLPLPTRILAHGWMTVNGEKMSKTAGNFLPPAPIAEAIGADPLRYYFLREIGLGQDGDFSHKNLLARYHGDLGNGLGNLLNRMVASIVQTAFGGLVPAPGASTALETALVETAQRSAEKARAEMDALASHKALEAVWELVLAANKYIDQCEPWKLAKDPAQKERLATVAYTVLEALRWLSVMLWPVMPEKSDAIRQQLGLTPMMPTVDLDLWPSAWGGLSPGTKTRPGAPLFPRFDEDGERQVLARMGVTVAPKAEPTKPKKEKTVTEPKPETKPAASAAGSSTPLPEGVISFDDLMKVEMRLGLVRSAERVPKSDKLLELKVEVGEAEPRNILAGIGQHYAPEALVGRRIAVVTNLAPRPLMGRVSQGMVLAVSDEGGLSVLSPDKEITPGVRVK